MQLGFLVKNLGATQLNFDLIVRANALVNQRRDANLTLFFEGISKVAAPPQFASMHISSAWGYQGPLVATTLSTASKLLRLPAASRRIFYCYDLEWHRFQEKNWTDLRSVYGSPALTLVARSQDHARVIGDAWNRVCHVIPDCDVEALLKLAHE